MTRIPKLNNLKVNPLPLLAATFIILAGPVIRLSSIAVADDMGMVSSNHHQSRSGGDNHGPYTLPECIEIALKNNPELAAQNRVLDAAEAGTDIATGQRWPRLSATGNYTYTLDALKLHPATYPGEPLTWTNNIFAGDLRISIPLFTGGQITNDIKAAELLAQSAVHQLSRTREELVFNISSVFYGILGQEKVVESLQFSRKALDEHRRQVRELIDAQKAARVDLLRVEVRRADIDQKLMREKNRRAIQYRILANLLGLNDSYSPLSIQGELSLIDVNMDLRGNLERARIDRSDYLAARAAMDAQDHRVAQAQAGHWPTISALGSYGERWAAGSLDQQPGADESNDEGLAMVAIDIPIFEGGRIAAKVRQEKAKLAVSREQLRGLELKIRLEVETALLNISSNKQRVISVEKSIEQARESLRIELLKYKLGKGSITEVLDSQSALLEVETSYYLSLAEYNTSIAQLRLAIGEKE